MTPPSIWIPDAPPASAGAEDDEFADASGGVPGGWTEVDHGSVLTVGEDELGLSLLSTSHAGNSLCGIYKTIPGTDFTYWTKVSVSAISLTTGILAGIALWEDATNSAGDVRTFTLEANATAVFVSVYPWTAYNAASAVTVQRAISVDVLPSSIYLRVRRTGTTYEFDFSTDGIGWQRIHTTGALGITPTHIGPAVDNSNTGASATARFPFWRYLASDVGLTGLVSGDRLIVVPA